MGKRCLIYIVVLLAALANGGGCNVFNDMSNKKSDDAIIDDINNLIDGGFWNDAVLKLSLISAAGLQRRDVKILEASAYAGRGGLDTINLITALNNNSSGGAKTLFQMLASTFKGATTSSFNDEVRAQNFIFSISNIATNRTVDENIFMVFIEFAKLGTLLAAVADTNGDGIIDPLFDNSNLAMLTNAQAAEVVVGISVILTSLNAAGSTIGSQSLGGATAACTAISAVDPTFCSTVDPSAVTGIQLQFARTLVGENAAGIGLNAAVTHQGAGTNCELISADVCQANAVVPKCLCP